MTIIIRKVPERDTSYLERLLPGAKIYCDNDHEGCRKSFEKAILMANDDAIYVQDDMILCKGFLQKAQAYIRKYPDEVIVFSNFTHDKNCKVFEQGFVNARKGGWLLCTYIPRRIAMAFLYAKEHKLFKTHANVSKYDFDDMEFCQFLDSVKKEVFVTVPNLAGHPKNESVTGFKRPPRICPNFDYENAEV